MKPKIPRKAALIVGASLLVLVIIGPLFLLPAAIFSNQKITNLFKNGGATSHPEDQEAQIFLQAINNPNSPGHQKALEIVKEDPERFSQEIVKAAQNPPKPIIQLAQGPSTQKETLELPPLPLEGTPLRTQDNQPKEEPPPPVGSKLPNGTIQKFPEMETLTTLLNPKTPKTEKAKVIREVWENPTSYPPSVLLTLGKILEPTRHKEQGQFWITVGVYLLDKQTPYPETPLDYWPEDTQKAIRQLNFWLGPKLAPARWVPLEIRENAIKWADKNYPKEPTPRKNFPHIENIHSPTK